ncbi:MAG: BBP7 family outer membrane beta-barrel protein, partial [Planctomycetaceae bacterium]|nr:BBP7 family outer membrane beta-barrel protein [Planctomycetaceae bacterium]
NLQTGRTVGTEAIGTTFFPNMALPLQTSGASTTLANTNAIVFDESVQLRDEAQVWGTEISFLTDPHVPGEGFKWQWLGGFRYLNLDERFGLTGVFNNGSTVADRITTITSDTINNVYGPEVGGRASIVHRWFSFGVTPRVMFGLNDRTAEVASDALGTGVVTRFRDRHVDFTPITQLSFTGEINLSQRFSVFGGYDFLWIPLITRAHENIAANSTPALGGGFDPDIRLANRREAFAAQGFSFGAVFRY